MATFFVGQRVRVIGVEPEAQSTERAAIGMEGVVNELGCTNELYYAGMVGVTLPIPARGGGCQDWCFRPEHLEPILPCGHTASTESFQELMDRLNTQRVEKVEEVGA
jgi:hypothetical protein